MSETSGRTFQRNNVRIGSWEISYLLSPGGSKNIVFLHGLGSTGNAYLRLARLFGPDYTLYLPDLLGHGRSSKPEIQYNINEQAAVIHDFVTSLGIYAPTVIGNSYGGWIAVRYFLNYRLPGNLVLISSAGVLPPAEETPDRKAFIERVIASSIFNVRSVIERMLETNRMEKRIDGSDFKEFVPPTLIIWGDSDNVIPVSTAYLLKERIPGSELLVVHGGGHTVHYTNPVEVHEAIERFIRKSLSGR